MRVTLELDTAAPAWDRFRALSYSHPREYVESVEGAARPETRTRRIDKAVTELRDKPVKPGRMAAPEKKAMNAAWHARHPMLERPTLEQRIAWHTQHLARCGCRPVPAKLRALIDA